MGIEKVFNSDEIKTSYGSKGELGSGSYATVRLCRHLKYGFIALKYFKSSGATEEPANLLKSVKESRFLLDKEHDNILKVYGLVTWENKYVGIVSEFAECKNLESLFLSKKFEIGFGLRLRIMLEINSGLEYLHSHNILHGDLKLQNLLLARKLQVKIADFGAAQFAHTIGVESQNTIDTPQYTPGYAAPERLNKAFDTTDQPTEQQLKQDMFSIAMVMYEIVTREYAFKGIKRDLIEDGIRLGQRPLKIKDVKACLKSSDLDLSLVCSLEDMIVRCWDNCADKRLPSRKVKEELQSLIQGRKDIDLGIDDEAEKLSDELKYSQQMNLLMDTKLSDFVPEKSLPSTQAKAFLNKDSLILIGGQATMKDVVRYVPDSQKWDSFASLNQGRCHHISIVVKKILFVIGGINKANVLDSVECFDPKEMDKWKTISSMNTCRYQASAEELRGDIHVLGGKNELDESLKSIEFLNTSQDQDQNQWSWTTLKTRLNLEKFNFSTFRKVPFGEICCCGGLSQKHAILDTIEGIKVQNGENCSEDKHMKEVARHGACAVTDGGKVYLIGGIDETGNAINAGTSCNLDNRESDAWKSFPNMKMKRCAFACGIVGKTIYAIGGHGENERLSSLSTMERINLKHDRPEWQLVPGSLDRNWAGHSVVVW